MSVLLPDDSYCTSEIGLILYRDRKNYGFFADVTNVKEPTSKMFGFVEYEVTITLTPHDSINNAPRKFKINTRFKELNRLHAQLSTIHRQLYLKDVFPSFAPSKMFGSAEPETIVERKKAINTFLRFVLNNEVLCKARCFQIFINSSEEEKQGDEIVPKNDTTVNDLITMENEPSIETTEIDAKAEENETENHGESESNSKAEIIEVKE